jgi:hypothetical protein
MFFEFLWIFQDSVKWLYYLRCRFAQKSPKVLRSYDSSLGLRFGPWKRFGTSQLDPWAPDDGSLAEFRRAGGRVRPDPAGEASCGSHWLHSRARLGRVRSRWGGSAATRLGGRWSSRSGERGGRGDARAAHEVAVVVHGGGGVLTQPVAAPNRKLTAAVAMAHGGRARRERGRVSLFIGGRACCSKPSRWRFPRHHCNATTAVPWEARACSGEPRADRWSLGGVTDRRGKRGLRAASAHARPGEGATPREHDSTSRFGVCLFRFTLVSLRFSPNIWIEVYTVVNRKVVDLTTLYNFYKGSRVFFSTDFAQNAAKLWMSPYLSEQGLLSVDHVFHPFPPKNLKCQSTWKLCPSTN